MLLLSQNCSRIPFQSDVRHAARIAFHPSCVLIGKRHARLSNRHNFQACGPDSPETRRSLPRTEISRFDFDAKRVGRSQAEYGSSRCTETVWTDDLVYPRLSETMLSPTFQSLDRLKDVRRRYSSALTCIQSTARSPRRPCDDTLNRQSLSKQPPTPTSALLPREIQPSERTYRFVR